MKNIEPICPFDRKPCKTPEKGCQGFAFGSLAPNGTEKTVWECPRFSVGKKLKV